MKFQMKPQARSSSSIIPQLSSQSRSQFSPLNLRNPHLMHLSAMINQLIVPRKAILAHTITSSYFTRIKTTLRLVSFDVSFQIILSLKTFASRATGVDADPRSSAHVLVWQYLEVRFELHSPLFPIR